MADDTTGWFGRWAAWVLAHRRAVAAVLVVLTVVSAIVGLPPKVDPDLLALLPDEEKAINDLRALHAEEGGVNLVTLAFGSEDQAELDAFVAELATELNDSERVTWAMHALDEDEAAQLGVLQLRADDIDQLRVRLTAAMAMGSALSPPLLGPLMQMGPVAERIEKVTTADQLLGDQGSGRVMVRPTHSAHDQKFAMALVDEIEAAIEAHQAKHPSVELQWFGGAYRHNVEDVRGIQTDLFSTAGVSALMVLLVVMVAFRSWKGALLVFLPLVAASLINLAIARLWMGHLTTYTAFCSAILFGLGIDFAVHLVGRYRELRAAGMEVEDAIIAAWSRTGPPCFTAAITSAAGFMALGVADFRGFSQLGWLLAAGLMVCLAAMLTALPILLAALDRNPKPMIGTQLNLAPSTADYKLAPVGLGLAALATLGLAVWVGPKLSWEYDFSALRRDGLAYNELSDVERKLARESYSPIIVTVPSADALADAQQRADAAIEAGELPHVQRAVSLANVLPADQADRVAAIERLQTALQDPKKLRYIPPALVKQLLPLREVDARTFAPEDLPEPIQDVLGVGKHRLLLFPEGNMWDLREAAKLKAELESTYAAEPVAGEYMALGALFGVVQRDMPWVAVVALIFVTLLTAGDLRRVHWVAGAMFTLLGGMVWAAVATWGAGVKLSIINVVGVPILLGIGVDMVIHLLHRLREEGPGGVRRSLYTTGIAAALSTLTTVLSFASLTLAGNRGVRSLGLLVVLGLIAIFAATATLLPLAWSAGWRLTGRAPADQPAK